MQSKQLHKRITYNCHGYSALPFVPLFPFTQPLSPSLLNFPFISTQFSCYLIIAPTFELLQKRRGCYVNQRASMQLFHQIVCFNRTSPRTVELFFDFALKRSNLIWHILYIWQIILTYALFFILYVVGNQREPLMILTAIKL